MYCTTYLYYMLEMVLSGHITKMGMMLVSIIFFYLLSSHKCISMQWDKIGNKNSFFYVMTKGISGAGKSQ